jgi:hypothetical protein
LVLNHGSPYAAQQKTPGHSIGQVSPNGDLIVIELDPAALGQPNLFDLSAARCDSDQPVPATV